MKRISGAFGLIAAIMVFSIVPTLSRLQKVSAVGPIQITNCEELQAMNNDVTESYELANDIDCSTLLGSSTGLEDFEGDTSGWTFNGTDSSWNIYTQTCATESLSSPYTFDSKVLGTSGNAGADCSGNHQEESYALSPAFTLPTGDKLYLKLDSMAIDENGPCTADGEFDRKSVFIAQGMTDTVLNDCYPLNQSNEMTTAPDKSTWVFDISAFSGQNIQIGFNYSTGDNCCEFEYGWFIDNLIIGEGVKFDPIGSESTPFTGTFNGQGHSVTGLSVTQSTDAAGLFGVVGLGATVSNVTVEGGHIDGVTQPSGGVAGKNYGTIENVVSKTEVSGSARVGGMVGANDAGGTISHSYAVADVEGHSSVGGFVGENYGVITTSYSSSEISSLTESGGFVGSNRGNGEISRSFSTSNLGEGPAMTASLGGFAGSNVDSAVIHDAYATGEIRGNSVIGGFVGLNDGGTIRNAYSSGSVTAAFSLGGFAGSVNGTLQNVFTTSHVVSLSDPVDHAGALIGTLSDGPIMNSYFDAVATGLGYCAEAPDYSGVDVTGCLPVNVGSSNPNYFVNNKTNTPLDTWDFDQVWKKTSSGLPVLIDVTPDVNADSDGVDDAVEDAAPNSGDANNDGIPDKTQAKVASLPSPVSGKYVVLESSCGALNDVSIAAESSDAATDDDAFVYPGGIATFTVTGCTSGATATITHYYYGEYDVSKVQARKYNPTNHTYMKVEGATAASLTIGGQKVTKVQYAIVDGGLLDEDGLANGTIVDPAGMALAAVNTPNTGIAPASLVSAFSLVISGLLIAVLAGRKVTL